MPTTILDGESYPEALMRRYREEEMLSNTPKFYSHAELHKPALPAKPLPSEPKPNYFAALYAVGEALL